MTFHADGPGAVGPDHRVRARAQVAYHAAVAIDIVDRAADSLDEHAFLVEVDSLFVDDPATRGAFAEVAGADLRQELTRASVRLAAVLGRMAHAAHDLDPRHDDPPGAS